MRGRDDDDGRPQQVTGRPRDARADRAIVDAALELLTEQGYSRLSMDSVARRAGVARATVYRRWPSKAHLVHEAVFPKPEDTELPETGDLAEDVRLFVHGAAAIFSRSEVMAAVPGLMAEFQADPKLREILNARLDAAARDRFRALVARAVERGEARPDVDADVLFDTAAGSLIFGLIVTGHALEAHFVDELARLLTLGARSTGQSPEGGGP